MLLCGAPGDFSKKNDAGSPNFATVVESFTTLSECKRMDPGYKVIIMFSFLTHCKDSGDIALGSEGL